MAEDRTRPHVSVRSINCPSCGAAVAVRTFGHAVNVVCPSCGSLLDARDAGVAILQQFAKAVRFDPLIPLGTRGTIAGATYEVVGFQVREIVVDGTEYRWREYLLFNPYQPFRYLTEFDGHWNTVTTLRSLPGGDETPGSEGPRYYEGQRYRHFQTATAKTIFVLGEFPWQVRVGETVAAADFVAPPRILSAEANADKEVTWSLGTYTSGKDVWASFALPGSPPSTNGIFANQPSPYTGVAGRMWRLTVMLVAMAALLWVGHEIMSRSQRAFTQAYAFDPRSAVDSSFVTPPFELDGRPSAVTLETDTDLENQWLFVGYALINEETGQAFEAGGDVSYYHGVEDGESWSEGSRRDTVTLPSVPPGRYFLRIESDGERTGPPLRYRVTVLRDVPTVQWFLIALGLLVVPPILTTVRALGFEKRRWQESDHPPGGSSSDDDSSSDDGDDSDDS